MNDFPSYRFYHFLFFKCKTIGTNGHFIGPEWARLAYKKLKCYIVSI